MAVDYARAMAANKAGGERGHSGCQFQVGIMYYYGRGVDVDYKQALPWFEKAAAQDVPAAIHHLADMYLMGHVATPSFRRAREYYSRASGLGNSTAEESMQELAKIVQKVMS